MIKTIITAPEVVALCTSSRLDPSLIKEAKIIAAEAKHIAPVLGAELYAKLCEDNVAEPYATLKEDYIKPACAYFVRYAILPDLTFGVDSGGVMLANPQFATVVSNKQMDMVAEQAYSDAQALLDRAVAYIRANTEQFPEWKAEVKVQKGGSIVGGILF